MSPRAKKSGIKLTSSSGKVKIRNGKSLLDMNMQVNEVNNDIVLSISADRIQLIDLFRYLLEKYIIEQPGIVHHSVEDSIRELPVNENNKALALPAKNESVLTDREFEIMERLSCGWQNKWIADDLGSTVNTVRNQLQKIYTKLKVHNRTEAILEYLKNPDKYKKISSGK